MRTEWRGFKGTHWLGDVNVRDFIQNNYTPYDGDASFLAGPTEATDKLWGALQELQKQERAKQGHTLFHGNPSSRRTFYAQLISRWGRTDTSMISFAS